MISQPATFQTGETNQVDLAAEADALAVADAFGAALRASPEFAGLVRAADVLAADAEANAAIKELNQRQAELRMQTMLGTLDTAQSAELEHLEEAMLAQPAVATYLAAQNVLQTVCGEMAAVASDQIGIDFAANCSAGGCCG